jgi:hypothetical protein
MTDKSTAGRNTSGNREESMKESGDDAFGGKKSVRGTDSTKEEQDPASSGTVPLGGESSEGGDQKESGGVEGTA